MPAPVVFYFDFASPYAYLAFDRVGRYARSAGREVDLRPVLVWALLKERGIAPPMEDAAKRAYLEHDMERSAAFYGVAYRQPDPLVISAHLAARFWLGMTADHGAPAFDLARRVFAARFVEGRDIKTPEVLCDIAAEAGLDRDSAEEAMYSDGARTALAALISLAVENGVIGVPYFDLDGEGFFGADRLPHLRWRLGLDGPD
ncbi:2-hydroxychromene-2-carboxylate isomerase [Salinihabitans flavidus]|uniref:2-hydroxychromene-2-carboxylate isomerase n=1 Tax=Salinihabitans flavidus TaxID=569882 RepID=A0A1H8PLL5_9RHOB|nr:2-hydroxychromene-2-carboxylate isomerase [Salinihabitans flavidus]SEO42666.1 2-hydroxychromene-2-carboxylate isomerase [Salinihabitans flavidus]